MLEMTKLNEHDESLPAPVLLTADQLKEVSGGYNDGYEAGPSGPQPPGKHTQIWAR